jgi:hypothetical protein
MLIQHVPIGYKTQSADTSVETELVLFDLLRSLSLWQKATKLSAWTKGCRELSLTGIKLRYPQASNAQIREQFAKATLNKEYASLAVLQNYDRPIVLNDPISLALVIAGILDLLEIPYLVGGSVASGLYGEPRSTQDIDLVVDLSLAKTSALIQAVRTRFYISEDAVSDAIRRHSSFNLIDLESLGKIDIFILKENDFSRSEFQRRQSKIVRTDPDRLLVIATPEDIILQKLLWFKMTKHESQKQWRDILGVMKLQGETLDFSYLWQWADTIGVAESLQKALTEAGLF